MIGNLVAELEQCLRKVDASGQILAAAHLSSAIEVLKASIAAQCRAPAAGSAHFVTERPANLFRFN